MSARRVKKFDAYWIIGTDLSAVHMIDNRTRWADTDYANGNYFNTKEEAETMARKLRAVLKGAEVIEMPSEDEIKRASYDCTDGYDDDQVPGFRTGVDWLKSKIVG